MRTLNVSISENDYKQYGIKKDQLTFEDLIDTVRREIAVENLEKCGELAEKYGLTNITPEEINEEIKAVRKDAKARR